MLANRVSRRRSAGRDPSAERVEDYVRQAIVCAAATRQIGQAAMVMLKRGVSHGGLRPVVEAVASLSS